VCTNIEWVARERRAMVERATSAHGDAHDASGRRVLR
jgi:hypothetical protein